MEDERLDQRLQLVISRRQIAAVDAWRRKQEAIPSRSEAIRRLIEIGITINPSGPRKKSKIASD